MQTKETKAKKAQLIRLLISFDDLKEAFDIAGILQEEISKPTDKILRRDLKIHNIKCESLSDALTIAYARPFSGNDKKKKNSIPDLSQNVLKILGYENKQLHQFIIDHRNKAVAHSDSELIDMEPFYLMIGEQKVPSLIPLRNKTKFIFSSETLIEIKDLCAQLMTEINLRKDSLAKELEDYIIRKRLGEDTSGFPFNGV